MNIVAIAVILGLVFLSQQPQFKPYEKKLDVQVQDQTGPYWSKTVAWFNSMVYPKVSGGVSALSATASQKITQQKNNLAQNLWENIKNYFAKKFSDTFGTKVN